MKRMILQAAKQGTWRRYRDRIYFKMFLTAAPATASEIQTVKMRHRRKKRIQPTSWMRRRKSR
ncbi:MAG: hypothetical protein ACLT76_09850 [Clostridium fessum]